MQPRQRQAGAAAHHVRFCTLLLGIVAFGCGEDNTAPTGLAWEIVSPSGARSTVLGTLHLGVSARDDLADIVWDRFNSADALVVEAEIRTIDPAEYRAVTKLPAGESLKGAMPKDAWNDLFTLLQKADPVVVDRLRAWAVRSEVFRVLFPTHEGMDLTLLNEADVQSKTLHALETWQEQIAPLNQVPLSEDAASLVELLENRDAIKRSYAELVDYYRAGNAEQALTIGPAAWSMPHLDSSFYDSFIKGRNDAWMPKLLPHLQRGNTFVAVGYAHLVGAKGLIEALKKSGYAATQLLR
jgi:uncharacterized protein YbaP (TraB family)